MISEGWQTASSGQRYHHQQGKHGETSTSHVKPTKQTLIGTPTLVGNKVPQPLSCTAAFNPDSTPVRPFWPQLPKHQEIVQLMAESLGPQAFRPLRTRASQDLCSGTTKPLTQKVQDHAYNAQEAPIYPMIAAMTVGVWQPQQQFPAKSVYREYQHMLGKRRLLRSLAICI